MAEGSLSNLPRGRPPGGHLWTHAPRGCAATGRRPRRTPRGERRRTERKSAMRFPAVHAVALTIFSALVIGVPWLAQAQQPIRIGVSMALTGKYALQGGYARDGYQLCQTHVNAQGGVLGRPMELVIRDDRSEENTAIGVYEKLIAEDRVDAVLGPYSSPITDAVADVTEKHRKLLIAPLAGTTSLWE